MRPWKVLQLHRENQRHPGFNGATAMRPWKVLQLHRENQRHPGFNGATAMTPWKGYRVSITSACLVLLQWGHGDEAVERW
jgi:hypothetical protein